MSVQSWGRKNVVKQIQKEIAATNKKFYATQYLRKKKKTCLRQNRLLPLSVFSNLFLRRQHSSAFSHETLAKHVPPVLRNMT